MSDFRRELEVSDAWPKAWLPESDGVLIGVVEGYELGPSPFGQQRICVVRDDNTGELRSLWLMHEVLRREFEKLNPKVGERVGVRYVGKSEDGRYKKFRVAVDRPRPRDYAGLVNQEPKATDTPGAALGDESSEKRKNNDDRIPF